MEPLQADILLVDDTPANLLALGETLANLGQNIVKANSGKEALKILLKRDFAVILIDINMPGMDGFETAALIRQRKNSQITPIIFVTAYESSDNHRIQGYSLGAVDYIFSPVVPSILRSKVSVFVELYKKNAQVRQLNEELKNHANALEKKIQERTWALSCANKELIHLNKIKSEFTSMVTHELRTPLTAIKEGIELVLDGIDGPVTPEQASSLTISKANVDRLAKLIQNVLDFSKFESGKIEVVFEKTDMIALLTELQALMNPFAHRKGILLAFHLPEGEFTAPCDADKIRQLVINLVDNAIKYTEKGGEVSVRLASQEESVLIEVEDTGIGIKKEDQEKIFEMFAQGFSPRGRKAGGVGIGLAVCRQIAQQHHGTLIVESSPEKGSKFSFSFPKRTEKVEFNASDALIAQTA